MSDEVLKQLQTTEIEILNEVVRICDKYKINYFLLYGTLLGAVRHFGFIPWDDDIDIAMPRKDYNLFIEKAKKELKGKYKLDYIKNNDNYYLTFLKVRNTKTIYDEANLKNYQGNKGIWIDIFPLDYAEEIDFKVKLKNKIVNTLSKVLSYKSINLKKNNFLFNFFIKVVKIIPNKTIISFINKLLNNELVTAKYLISYCDFDCLEMNTYLTKDIFPLKKLKFGKNKYNVPSNYDSILKTMYGNDYMELPPLEKRVTHNPLYIKFENKQEYYFKENK